jgi:hypothetical protein
MASVKEPRFFNLDSKYGTEWEWYHSLFDHCQAPKATGEASVTYYLTNEYPDSLPRLFHHYPQAKIVLCVRHPLRRIESAWKQAMSTRHHMPRDFNDAVRNYYNLIEGSLYWAPMEECLRYTNRDNIHLLFFEEFCEDPRAVLDRLLKFLDVDPESLPESTTHVKQNVSSAKRVDSRVKWWLFQNAATQQLKPWLPRSIKRFAG